MAEQSEQREPMLAVPSIVVILVGLLVAVHLARQALTPSTDDWFVTALGFVPLRYTGDVDMWPGGLASAILSPVTHFLVHGDLTHLAINGAMLVAFGSLLARRMGAVRLVVFTAVCSAGGALLFQLSNHDQAATMIGASGGISGLMAAALRLMFSVVDLVPYGTVGDVLRRAPDRIPLEPLRRALGRSGLRTATVVWTLVNLLAAFGLGTPPDSGAIAWEAHIGGFLTGLVVFAAFDPGVRQDGVREWGVGSGE